MRSVTAPTSLNGGQRHFTGCFAVSCAGTLYIHFYSAPQCSHCKRCISYSKSVRLSVTRQYCVKTTARTTVQFALSDSKMCLVFYKLKKYSGGTTPSC